MFDNTTHLSLHKVHGCLDLTHVTSFDAHHKNIRRRCSTHAAKETEVFIVSSEDYLIFISTAHLFIFFPHRFYIDFPDYLEKMFYIMIFVVIRAVRNYRYTEISQYFISQYPSTVFQHCIDFLN